MKNDKININQNVAILCDGNNIERSIQSITQSNSMLNFDSVIPRILNGRALNRLIYFREGRNISSKLADRLHENFFGSVVPCHKTADIPLSIKATQLASKVDTIIILSGDSDFVDLVRHLKSEGVRVEIAAVKETSARILLEEVDYFHPITKNDIFEYNKTKYNQRPDSRGQNNGGNYNPQNKDYKKQYTAHPREVIKKLDEKIEVKPPIPAGADSKKEENKPEKESSKTKKKVSKKKTTKKKTTKKTSKK